MPLLPGILNRSPRIQQNRIERPFRCLQCGRWRIPRTRNYRDPRKLATRWKNPLGLLMSGDSVQVGSDGGIRIKDDGIVIAGDSDPCCCAGCIPCTDVSVSFEFSFNGDPTSCDFFVTEFKATSDPSGTYDFSACSGARSIVAGKDYDFPACVSEVGDDGISMGFNFVVSPSLTWAVTFANLFEVDLSGIHDASCSGLTSGIYTFDLIKIEDGVTVLGTVAITVA